MSTEATITFPRNRYRCPLPQCSWTYDEPDPGPGAVVGAADITAFLAEHFAVIESAVKAHLETHALLEWVTEINRLREVSDRVAIALSDSGQIGAFIRSAVAPGSPVAQSRLDLLELLRRDSVAG